jgi:glucose/arabinose dehydrogenase
MKLLFPLALFILLLGLVIGTKGFKQTGIQPLPSPTKTVLKDYPKETVLAQGLDTPWALTFLPDGSMLVTERPGRVRLIDSLGKLQTNPLLTISEVVTYPASNPSGESGLMGIAVDPKFADNHFVYLYYTYQVTNGEDHNRLVRYEIVNNQLRNPLKLLDNVPGNIRHDGGRLKFGPDGYLYLTTGDSLVPSRSQDRTNLAGKILRLTTYGKPAPGNPFGNEVYTYGNRNPQGIAWDTDGTLYETEHGDSAHDEINRIRVGANYGWSTIQGDQSASGMTTPLLNSENITWAPSGMAFNNGAFYFGELKGAALGKAVINGNSVDYSVFLSNEFGRIRDVVTGPDGMLYITTSNRDGRTTPGPDDDQVIRINPSKL